MSSPVSIFSSIAQNLLGKQASQQNQLRIGQSQQQLDLEKQQEQRAQQQADLQFHEAMLQRGGVPVVNGMKQSSVSVPGIGDVPLLVKADPAHVIKYKDATGDTVQYELSPENQLNAAINQARGMAPVQAETEQGNARARAVGAEQGQQDVRDKYAVPASTMYTPEMLQRMGIQGDYKALQPELSALAGRAVPAVIRGDTQEDVADKRNQGAFDRTKYKADLDAQSKQAALDLRDQQFTEREADQDKWKNAGDVTRRWLSTQTTGRQKLAQDAVDARNFLDNFERTSQQHASLTKAAYGEQQKQIAATGILGTDPTGQPNTKDGESFVDPWDGKTKQMNVANRVVLGSRLGASQKQLGEMQGNISNLENVRDGLVGRIGSGQGSTQRIQGGSAQQAAGAPGAPQPGARAAKTQGSKVATKAQVQVYAQQKGISEQQATQEFQQSGYTVK